MFGLFKARQAVHGPYEFKQSVEIDRAAAEVFPLLDPADKLFAKRQLGEQVEQLSGELEAYSMILEALPDVVFQMSITERIPGQVVAFNCFATPMVGNMALSHEMYRVEPLGNHACRVELIDNVTFAGKMRKDDLPNEALMVTLALHNALEKLKIHAEQSADAVRAVNEELVVGWDSLVFGED